MTKGASYSPEEIRDLFDAINQGRSSGLVLQADIANRVVRKS
jgi:hypothetical protein